MNLFTLPPRGLVMVLIVLLMAAAVFDVLYRRIPNWLTVSGVLLGIALNAFIGPPEAGLVFSLAGLAVGFGIYAVLCLAGDGRGRRKTHGGGRRAGRIPALVRNLFHHGADWRSHGLDPGGVPRAAQEDVFQYELHPQRNEERAAGLPGERRAGCEEQEVARASPRRGDCGEHRFLPGAERAPRKVA